MKHGIRVGGDLNVFQRLMLQWETLHPYNGLQLLRVPGRPPAAIESHSSWAAAARASGLGPVRVVGRMAGRWYLDAARDFEPPEVGSYADESSLMSAAGQWLNHRFDPARLPLRPLVLSTPDHTYLAIAYRHFIADSVTVRAWLRAWWLCLGGKTPTLQGPVPARGYYRTFRSTTRFSIFHGLLTTGRTVGDMARVQRLTGPIDSGTQCVLHIGGVGRIQPLVDAARLHGAKVTDVLLAALALATARHAPLKRASNRDRVAVGTIIDLRPVAARDPGPGLYLGYTNCSIGPNLACGMADAVRQIARQSALQRSCNVASDSMCRMAGAMIGGRRCTGSQLYDFYRKRMPLAGGLSNVNLAGTWVERECPSPPSTPIPAADHGPVPADAGPVYLRISPVGPTMPLVLASTTCHGLFGLTLTYRHPLVSHEAAAEIAHAINAQIRTFVSEQPHGPRLAHAALTSGPAHHTLSA